MQLVKTILGHKGIFYNENELHLVVDNALVEIDFSNLEDIRPSRWWIINAGAVTKYSQNAKRNSVYKALSWYNDINERKDEDYKVITLHNVKLPDVLSLWKYAPEEQTMLKTLMELGAGTWKYDNGNHRKIFQDL